MDQYPKPTPKRGRGRGRGGRGRSRGRGRGQGASARQSIGELHDKEGSVVVGPDGSGRYMSQGNHATFRRRELVDNHARYGDLDESEVADDDDDDDDIEFYTASQSGMQATPLDSEEVSQVESKPTDLLAIDFAQLQQVLSTAPRWLRLGGDDRVRSALGEDYTDDTMSKSSNDASHSSEMETDPHTVQLKGTNLAQSSTRGRTGEPSTSVHSEVVPSEAKVTSSAEGTASPIAAAEEDDDGFDEWFASK